MIRKISVEKTDRRKYTPTVIRDDVKKQPSFTGLEALGNLAVKGMQYCEAEPMLNVTVLDLSTAIIPRSIIETVAASKQTDENGNPVLDENGKQKRKFNILAGFEALRREGSGLLINCILPGVFVMGAAKLFNNPIMGNKSNLVRNWADKATLTKLSEYYQGTGTENYSQMLKRMFNDLTGVDGKTMDKSFAKIYEQSPKEFDKIFDNLAKLAATEGKIDDNVLKAAINNIVEKTHISENIKFITNNPKQAYFNNSLESLMRNTVEVLHDAKNAGIESAEEFSKYITKAKKLVNYKSWAGMAVVIPLALAAQPINRWITHKTSGRKGAPIYNDEEERILSHEEKGKLLKQKFISIGSMLGLSWLSMMKMPNLGMLEFKKFFPSMDQARIVSTATFASRMGASEDFNDLRESTVRDLATFSSFYFLGDYAAKAIASVIEKFNPDIKLLNELKPLKEGANPLQKFWHWTKNTTIKTSGELTSEKATNLRSCCQFGNLFFSLMALGLFIPLINRIQTNKKEQARKAGLAQNATASTSSTKSSQAAACCGATAKGGASSDKSDNIASENGFGMNLVDKKSTAFGAFFNS